MSRYIPSTHVRDGLGKCFAASPTGLEEIAELRAAVLVPHAIGKCDGCGATLVADPLPHRCDPGRITRSSFAEAVELLSLPWGDLRL